VQGLLAAGADPARVRAHGRTPLDYLAARQAADGHYRYSASTDQTPVWVTGQVLMAVNRRPLPLAAVARSARAARHKQGNEGTVPAGSHASTESGSSGRTGHGSSASGQSRGGPAKRDAGKKNGNEGSASADPIAGAAPVAQTPTEAGGGSTATYVGVGLGALAAALAAGFFFYRRNLP
jgi:hypothetical protein